METSDKYDESDIAELSAGIAPNVWVLLDGCSDREKAWFACYVGPAFPNKAEAARMSGCGGSGAKVTGCKIARRPKVAAAIAAHLETKGVSKSRILERLSQIAFADPSELLDSRGIPDLKKIKTAELGGIVRGYEFHGPSEFSSGTTLKSVEIGAPEKALELLGKTLGMFTDKMDVTSGGLPIKAYVSVDLDAV